MVSQACLFTTGTTRTVFKECLFKYVYTPSISRGRSCSPVLANSSKVLMKMLLVPKYLRLSSFLRTVYRCHSPYTIHYTIPSPHTHPLTKIQSSLCEVFHFQWAQIWNSHLDKNHSCSC